MPTYVFKHLLTGKHYERTLTLSELDAMERADGSYDVPSLGHCIIDVAAQNCGFADASKGCYPFACEASAVHPDQVGESMERAARHGAPTEFDKYGRPIFTSARHRQAFLRAFGMFDRDGVFSPRNV